MELPSALQVACHISHLWVLSAIISNVEDRLPSVSSRLDLHLVYLVIVLH